MHIILTGATGTVGAATLEACLASQKISKLTILSRRPMTVPTTSTSAKANVVVHTDYTSYPDALKDQLKGAQGCIWAQGISQSQVSKPEYIEITYDYPIAAATAFSGLNGTGNFNFVYVSGEGADPTEKTFTLFGKIKGRAEKKLLEMAEASQSLSVYNVRPAFVDPALRGRRGAVMTFLGNNVLGPAVRFFPSLVIPSRSLGDVLVDLATGNGEPIADAPDVEAGGRTLRNTAVRRLAGL